MAISNRERIRKALDELKPGLIPYVERELRSKLGGYWIDEVTNRSRVQRKGDGLHWDTQGLLKAMIDNWQGVFRYVLGHVERSYVGELLDVRNKWAHEKTFTSDDVYRALDTMQRLLESVSSADRASAIGTMKADLQRQVFAEQSRNKTRYKQITIEGLPLAGLKPWRELIEPHQDVASGTYMQAEFAADLAQVQANKGSDEYRDPNEFYRRTFVTSGLRDLLSGALSRIAGGDGDPVVELQTNFGGGKTHSMLALYHLFSGIETATLAGIEPVLTEAGVDKAPKASRAVLVGTALSPGQVSKKDDGTEVRTLWGELAWQLGGKKAFDFIAESDRVGVSPGANDLGKVFAACSPCLVLIDEWVAYARQLLEHDDSKLPGGTFEAQCTFVQALTEAAKATPKTLVVASIPQSKHEIGGSKGEDAVAALKNVFTRVGKPWRPATSDEGFEIVRRRLFEPIAGKGAFAARDAVIDGFAKMYRDNPGDFPSETTEGTYREDLRSSYPFHPELFRRLYDDWSTLDKFQRTRGVLRLLAKVVHRLWESSDAGLLILPASVPMGDHAVKSELTRYLDDVWEPIISQDVDGPNSLPLAIDQEVRHLGRYSACRRVARALYIGTAPGAESATPGVGTERLRLACAQPGETVAAFGDALRRVSEKAQYVHQDGNRYWLSTHPNLNRTAEDRAAALMREPEELHAEIVSRLESDHARGDFAGVHICPDGTADVPDEPAARLVVLGPKHPHKKNDDSSAARSVANDYLTLRGTSPRLNRNVLVFLAPDHKTLGDLMTSTAHYLAWKSILKDKQSLNLDQFQLAQAESKEKEYDHTTNLRISATWVHALVPLQERPAADVTWDQVRISGNDSLAKRTSAKLVTDEALFPKVGGVRLRMTLDKSLWPERDHVTLAHLAEWFPRYLYLPRVKNRNTLVDAIRDGGAVLTPDDTFATAEKFDEATGRYLGLRVGSTTPSAIDNDTCIVKVDVARKQQAADQAKVEGSKVETGGESTDEGGSSGGQSTVTQQPEAPTNSHPTLFVGSVKLNGARVGRDAGRIADEVLSHLAAIKGAKVTVSMEIQVEATEGFKDDVVRTVSENATALKFEHAEFEKG